MSGEDRPYRRTIAALATMHGKERVIAPVLEWELGLRVALALGVNTDLFGTFSREVERTGSQLDAARAKIAAAFEYAPYARVAIASEGSFGPHPFIPFLALGRELVLLIDRESGIEIAGHDASFDTNFKHAIVSNADAAIEFAERVKFPEHGLIVMSHVGGKPVPGRCVVKDIADREALRETIRHVVSEFGGAYVETDMRAHRNPTRMNAIERATADLVRRFRSRCPACSHRGFDVVETIPGVPCSACGEPTRVVRSKVWGCALCGYRKERPVGNQVTADPGQCDSCNP